MGRDAAEEAEKRLNSGNERDSEQKKKGGTLKPQRREPLPV